MASKLQSIVARIRARATRCQLAKTPLIVTADEHRQLQLMACFSPQAARFLSFLYEHRPVRTKNEIDTAVELQGKIDGVEREKEIRAANALPDRERG